MDIDIHSETKISKFHLDRIIDRERGDEEKG